jgi:hypothetical protein
MGDAIGPFFGTCGDWISEVNDKCLARLSSKGIDGVRIGVSVALVVVVILGSFGCYKVIKKPDPRAQYQSIDSPK